MGNLLRDCGISLFCQSKVVEWRFVWKDCEYRSKCSYTIADTTIFSLHDVCIIYEILRIWEVKLLANFF